MCVCLCVGVCLREGGLECLFVIFCLLSFVAMEHKIANPLGNPISNPYLHHIHKHPVGHVKTHGQGQHHRVLVLSLRNKLTQS